MPTLTAGLIWLGPSAGAIQRGAITLDEGGRVLRIGRTRGRLQYPAILPGLIDAHLHAALPPLCRPVRAFVPWIRAVLAARSKSSAPPLETARSRLHRAALAGVCGVGEVDSTGSSPEAMRRLAREVPAVRIAGRCYRELVGFNLDARSSSRLLRSSASPTAAVATRRCPAGWSPHAPYSVSAALLRAASRSGRPLMVHVAESVDEVEFLRTGGGPFRDLLEELGRLPAGFRPQPNMSAVEWLRRGGALRRGTVLVHCQHLEVGDLARIRAARAAIVVCPGTIRYFRREPPPVPAWLAAGIPVALGTESLASHDGRGDLLDDLRTARELWPGLSPAQLFTMATEHGGRAICRPRLGRLRADGRLLDAWATAGTGGVGLPRTAATVLDGMLEGVTSGAEHPTAVWVGGVRIDANSIGSRGTA